ncbi:TonB-dependent receptor [Altererythrobacter aurantiacus]|uniref:TonB-dependent receptor n=1 Tax=Parapontixanthobacter aurantiacus TaxID=1463599 RepID=A0A844ZGZ5_9SPHN|nr:TonB-dependent receptor [Parapontixanthobacter aurantiacus]MXO86522.1 TonB-dependent receptor [Parapontixanthobacter aurantiacus]
MYIRKIFGRPGLLAGTALAIAVQASSLTAQELPEEQTGSEVEGAPIVVTGSRIPRPEVESEVPVAIVDSEQILRDAAGNVSDVINELPQVGIGSTRTNTNFLTSGTGIATVNLRALGSSRTLTLVNGRRFISGFAGDSAVDLNNIPIDLIERFEVVTGGSSAVYGSDAVAGVVNFILRDEFDGFQVRAQAGITEAGDNPRYLLSAMGGTTWGNDSQGNIILNFQYDQDEGLRSRNRDISDEDCANLICGPASYSSFAPQGQFQLVDAGGTPVPILPGDVSTFSFNRDNSLAYISNLGAPGYGFNRNNERYISVPIERYLAYAVANYDLGNAAELYGEATYARVLSNSRLEPFALDLLGDIYFRPQDPFGIPITNAFIPDDIAAAIEAANSDADPSNDVDAIGGRRRQNDVFDRSNTVKRETWRAVLGIRGDFTDRIGFDVSYVYGHLVDFNASEDIDNNRYRNALDSIRLGSGDVVGVDIVCRSEEARAEGCVPIDLFGFNTVDPAAAAYVQAVVPKSQEITNEQHVATAVLSSADLFDLWGAGGVGAALGIEYRYDSTVDDLDILTNTGGNSGNTLPDLVGSQDVFEVFGEVSVPLISDAPFFHYLGLNGAARYSDYSTIGSVFSWNAGAEWEPVSGLKFRGRYAVSNRAPNNSELFSQPSETFASVIDPCDGVTATSTGEFDAACRAIPAINSFLAANPGQAFTYTLADTQGVNGFIGGNINLQEETSTTITAGVVVAPNLVRGLSLSVDYFDISIEDAVSTVGRNFTIQECLLTNEPVFCDQVIRFPTGRLQTVNSQLINIAGFDVRGVDAQLRYQTAPGFADDDFFSANINYTYLIDFITQSDPSSDPVDNAGTFGASFSTHRASARATYGVEGISLSWQTTFLSGAPYINPDNFISNNPDVVALNDIDDYFLHNAQISFDPNENITFYFNVDNIFDTKPQYLPGTPFGTPTGLETAPDFDLFGRRYTAGIRAKL